MSESYRRLSKDYERSQKSNITLIYTSMIHKRIKKTEQYRQIVQQMSENILKKSGNDKDPAFQLIGYEDKIYYKSVK